jgi:hypothetical protein
MYFNNEIPFERHPIIGGKKKDQPAENQSESPNAFEKD